MIGSNERERIDRETSAVTSVQEQEGSLVGQDEESFLVGITLLSSRR